MCGSRRARINHRYAHDRSEAADIVRKSEREKENGRGVGGRRQGWNGEMRNRRMKTERKR